MPVNGIYNHKTCSLSELEMRMVYSIPEGGNWKNIPDDIESDRIKQIKKTGGRTTYYGRLRWNHPAYTISTYFSRTGNGCFIHPEQHRLISLREGARLQSFPDDFIFSGSKTSMYYQIGNAVPPLMARAISEVVTHNNFVDLFCGAGGFSRGIEMAGGRCELALDFDRHCCETYKKNHMIAEDMVINADIRKLNLDDLFSTCNCVDLVVGGPPCQGFSTAGWMAIDDPRNELVKYFIKSVEKISPKYFIMENVKGIAGFQGGKIIREILSTFKNIGYDTQWKILTAADYGVPQLRDRVIIIGNRINKQIEFPAELFSKDGKVLPKYITVREAIDDLPTLNMGEGSMDYTPYAAEPSSEYQLLMRGLITFNEFYNKIIEKNAGIGIKPKLTDQTNFSNFH